MTLERCFFFCTFPILFYLIHCAFLYYYEKMDLFQSIKSKYFARFYYGCDFFGGILLGFFFGWKNIVVSWNFIQLQFIIITDDT